MSDSELKLKLLIDTKNQRVLFAEADKDFVNFLFTLLSLPIGTVTRILTKEGMVGSLGRLYESIENCGYRYMQPNVNKDSVLKPKLLLGTPDIPLLTLTIDTPTPKIKTIYRCSRSYYNCSDYATDDPGARCPQCNYTVNRVLSYVAPPFIGNQDGPSVGQAGLCERVGNFYGDG